LSIKSFLKPYLVLSNTVLLHRNVGLLLCESVVLDHGLLEKGSEAHALVNVGLDLVLSLAVLAHLHILFEFLDEAVLLLHLDFHVAVLTLELLHEEAFQIVCLLADGSLAAGGQVVGLLLELSREGFNVLLLAAKVDVHLLCPSAQASVLILGDVELNFQISVIVLHVLLLKLFEKRRLVGFSDAGVCAEVGGH
jgi:hypothetical protein